MSVIRLTMSAIRHLDLQQVAYQSRAAARRFGWALIAAGLLAGLVLAELALPRLVAVDLLVYAVQPVMWLSFAILAVCLWLAAGEQLRLVEQRGLILMATVLGATQVAVSVLLGMLAGFGRSPYAHSLAAITLNLWFVLTRLAGIETIRWYLGKSVGRIHSGWGYVIAWLLPMLVLIPFGQYASLGAPQSALRFTGQTLLPAAAENLLAAYLAIAVGPLASIAYRGVLQAFEWLAPILPDLPWIGAALAGVVVPVLGLTLLSHQEAAPREGSAEADQPAKDSENSPAVSWLLVAALAVGVIWLNSGFLGIRPSLVSGNSMNPTLYPGDIVITRTTTADDVVVGDIIRFRRNGIDVVHRVIGVDRTASTTVFTTRGDNNNVNDDPVMDAQLEGKVIMTIPKIGWISIGIRQAFGWIGEVL